MLIGIIILICAITVVYVFRRHGNSLGLQQGKDTLSLPVIEFDDKDEYGDELRASLLSFNPDRRRLTNYL